MIHIRPLMSDRINARLTELTVGDSLALVAMPEFAAEAARSEFLRRVVAESTGAVSDPADWTVEERIWAVAHYLGAVDGQPNIRLMGGGVLTDYLLPEQSMPPGPVDLEQFGAGGWTIGQMTGSECELVESRHSGRVQWILADMAVRLRTAAEDRPDHKLAPGQWCDWLARKIEVLKALPSSDMDTLFAAYRAGLPRVRHLWHLELSDRGHVCMPVALTKTREAGGGLPPVRFPVSACVGSAARALGFVVA
ncbi:hypothetical protein [Ideonella livida]|uniref:Uncharacterized protein n=1 Tax=Ideonella livida TaxID=2707176 RepID=A0A7C9PEA7_9BURK|nr:hypothetical protein [Ideonella livida]NDY89693.1 hypothetical protein [Ideonella livida]